MNPNASTWRLIRRSPHLRQGSLDGACGAYCVAMATIVLGVATRARIKCLPTATPDLELFGDFWTKALEGYFTGTDKQEMLSLLSTLSGFIKYRIDLGSTERLLRRVAEKLNRNRVAIVGVDGTGSGHWVLAVGVETLVSKGSKTVTGILCLDPSEPTPPLAQWNARIELNPPAAGTGKLGYRMADGRLRSVKCKEAYILDARKTAAGKAGRMLGLLP
ncbi:MAG: hypothetical protein KF892_08545 [Rhizobacter sp.]|nr:hypothetical protein [Rhizobacter sp.]